MGLIIRAEEGRHYAGEVNKLAGRAEWERSKNQRVDQRERGRAGADGEAQGGNGGKACGPMFGKHPKPEAEVAEERVEPGRRPNIMAGLAKLQWIPKLVAGEEFGFPAGHAAADKIVGALVEVELQFVLEVSGGPYGAEGVGEA